MKNLSPYLMFDGTCKEAMHFYKDCLNGEIGYMGTFGDSPMEVSDEFKDKIMHVEFKFWGGSIMASDYMEGAEYTDKPDGSNIHLSLGFDDVDEMETIFNKLKEGGIETMPLKEQFWGDKFGMLTDKFGIKWMFNCAKKQ